MEGHIFGQGDGEIKPKGQVAVPLGEAVDLFLRLAAAFGQEDLRRFNDGGVQRGEAVEGIGGAEGLQHPLKLGLPGGQELHKTGQGPGFDAFHRLFSLLNWFSCGGRGVFRSVCLGAGSFLHAVGTGGNGALPGGALFL